MRSDILTARSMKMWYVALCSLVNTEQHFKKAYCLIRVMNSFNCMAWAEEFCAVITSSFEHQTLKQAVPNC